ncbi:protocadherin gamma-A7-like isoform X5 [Pristis pectinata]|uniref:protocadherin gamma-A7-like isoform X5 n=1 Tax=Pristis pectinata TaxID=685728 RepID=UPI00223D0063|nr:protocadherin gamma-A7-like isoform X5 [Pristis pectinata]
MKYKIYWLLKCQLLCCLFSLWGTVSGQIRYSVPEELPLGAFVGKIAADLGLDVNQLSARSLRIGPSPGKQYLEVNLENGILFVKEIIDREQLCGSNLDCRLSFDILLENPLSLYQVQVEILDVNDNTPFFPKSQFRLEILEFAVPGMRFPLEPAHDPDIGTNALQTYQLQENEYFALEIQMRSGKGRRPVLTLQKPLDREVISTHNLTLTAKDGGLPPRSRSVQVIVIVKDVNDNAPVFSQSVYRVSILESAPKRTLIITLNAIDLDDGPNGEITYSFGSHISAASRELFHLNSKTGEIRLKGNLDYEKIRAFEINIQAMDKGSGAIPEYCDVLVQVVDVNDNAPEVTLRSSSTAVSEDAPLGTVVALFSAEDRDSGQNGHVECQLSNQLPFKLDSSLKNYYRILVQHLLDRENNPKYDITIICTDAGEPPLTSKKTIRVEVSDINDNPPKFSCSLYTANVMENTIIGASIFSVTAFDPDVGENAQINFSILESQVQNSSIASFVSINSASGVIYAERNFDYEQLKSFQIQIQVWDSGAPALSSNASVNVVILDQNDNAPVITHPLPEYGSTATETLSRFTEPGSLLVKVSATDADSGQNARLTYQIFQATHHNLFTISADTGEIWTIRRILRKDASNQRLVVVVKDNGIPSLAATVTIVLSVVGTDSETFSSVSSSPSDPRITHELSLSLVIALGITSSIFLIILIILAVKIHRNRNGMVYQHHSLDICSCLDSRNSLNGIQKASKSLQIPPNYVEVFGGDPLSQRFRYESCSTLQSTRRDFIVPSRCRTSADKNFVLNEPIGKENTEMVNSEKYSMPEVKQPNTDWRLSQTHRAELNSSQYLEEEGVQREIQCEVQREVQRDVQREVPRDVQCDVPRNVQRDLQRDVHCDVQHVAENDPGGPRKPMCARPPAIPAGRDGWTLPRTAPRMQLQMTLGTHVPGTLRSQYLFPREPCTPGARISNSNVEFSAFPIGSLHCPWAANQTRDHRGLTHPGSRRPELDTEACGEIPCSPSSLRLSTQRLHSRDHHHALRQVNN